MKQLIIVTTALICFLVSSSVKGQPVSQVATDSSAVGVYVNDNLKKILTSPEVPKTLTGVDLLLHVATEAIVSNDTVTARLLIPPIQTILDKISHGGDRTFLSKLPALANTREQLRSFEDIGAEKPSNNLTLPAIILLIVAVVAVFINIRITLQEPAKDSDQKRRLVWMISIVIFFIATYFAFKLQASWSWNWYAITIAVYPAWLCHELLLKTRPVLIGGIIGAQGTIFIDHIVQSEGGNPERSLIENTSNFIAHLLGSLEKVGINESALESVSIGLWSFMAVLLLCFAGHYITGYKSGDQQPQLKQEAAE